MSDKKNHTPDVRFPKYIDNSEKKQLHATAVGVRNLQQNEFVQQQKQPPSQSSFYSSSQAAMSVTPQAMMPFSVGIEQSDLSVKLSSDSIVAPRRTIADFETCLIARRREEKVKKLQQEYAEMRREREECSKYSIKRVSIASDSETDDFPPLVSNLNRVKKKRKKSRGRKSQAKHRKSKRHRRSKLHNSSNHLSDESRSSSVEIFNDNRNSSKKVKVANVFDVENNPWTLLRPLEYSYRTAHLVVDTKGDPSNLKYDQPYSCDIAKHYSVNGVLSTLFGVIDSSEGALPSKTERYFNFFDRSPAVGQESQRILHHRESIKSADVESIPMIFAKGCKEQGVFPTRSIKVDLDQLQTNKASSWEKHGLEEKRVLLSVSINREPNNVDAWMKFIRLQDQLMAYEETGDAEAEVRNKRALYERKQSILREALKVNPSNICLRLEQLDIVEEIFGPASHETFELERCLMREFPCNIEMWQTLIQRKQHNRSEFEKNEMIDLIDTCLRNVAKRSDMGRDATIDHFLVLLILYRNKLLMECGFADQAVACLQALTEFHFFSVMDQPSIDVKLEERFENFWLSGVPRIGDDGAVGWHRSQTCGMSSTHESESLKNEVHEMRKKEDLILAICCERLYSAAEIWRQLETFRNQFSWRPVRSPEISSDLFQFPSRRVSFDQIRPLLFTFMDKSSAEDLVFKMLQLFGAIIPGMPVNSQEEILCRFSSDLFPSFRIPYEGMAQFLDNFFLLLSTAKDVDVMRVLSSRELTYAKFELSRPDKNGVAKENALHLRLQNIASSNDINETEKLSAFFHLSKSLERINAQVGSMKFVNSLLLIFSSLSSSLWSMCQEMRLIYLKMAKALCRRLPYADDYSADALQNLSKRAFLLRIGANGNTRNFLNESEQKGRAMNRWICFLKGSAENTSSKLDWLGNEAEIILELAATFFSEITDGDRLMKWKVFEKVATQSQLAKSLRVRPAVQKLRCKFYLNEMRKSKSFSPKELIRLLKDGIAKFPESIYFVKKFVDMSSYFEAVNHLRKNMGVCWLHNQIRSSALIFINLKKCVEGVGSQARLVQEVISTVTRKEKEFILPDAYLWFWLLSLKVVKESAKKNEEIFMLGHKHCPWSKQFLLECTRSRGTSGDFLPGIADIFGSSGLQMHCLPDEIPLLLHP